MTKQIFYIEKLSEIPVFLRFYMKVDYDNTEIPRAGSSSFSCYGSAKSYCYGSSKPISKLIENENETRIL